MENSNNFRKNLISLASEDDTADFTISCRGHDFHVPRTIVRLHSDWFARLFKSEWQSNKDSRIELNDDPLNTIHAMIDFFYRFQYRTTSYQDGHTILGDVATGSENANDYLGASVQFHAWVWTLADKYDIPDLKLLACENFEADCRALFSTRRYNFVPVAASQAIDAGQHDLNGAATAWFAAIQYIYENGNPIEKGLRASVVKVWRSVAPELKTRIGKEHWEELVAKFPDLGVDMAVGLDYKDDGTSSRQEALTREQAFEEEMERLRSAPRPRHIFIRQNDLARLRWA